MPNKILIPIAILAVILAGLLLFARGDEDTWICQNGSWVKHGNPVSPMPTSGCGPVVLDVDKPADKSDLIKVDVPQPNQIIKSPLTISGEARGTWFFEASFPIELLDVQGNVVATAIAQANPPAGGDWMTEDFVPFDAVIEFDQPVGDKGVIVFKKDNPSGLSENDDQLRLPIVFGGQSDTMIVQAFFGNNNLDPDMTCEKVFAVSRQVPRTEGVARAALQELLAGPNSTDQDYGFFTSINEGVQIQSLTIEDGVATVDFDEQIEYQLGGSCRVTAIRAQITETLMQFDTVDSVVISVDGRTEDILQP